MDGITIIKGMKVWYKGFQAQSITSRTNEQKAWDKAISTAAEYVRRRQNYNETLAKEILFGLSSVELPKDE